MKGMSQAVLGSTTVDYQGETIDFAKPFARTELIKAVDSLLA